MRNRILIVDDEPAVRKTICRVLEQDGMETGQAACGKEAIALLTRHSYDLVILDLMLGDLSGFEIIETVREADADIPLVVLSAKVQDNDKVFALAIGADDYITKPFSPHYLCAKVKAALRRSNAARKNEVSVPPFRFLVGEYRLFRGDAEIRLTATESKLMLHFMLYPGKVCSKEELYRQAWGNHPVDDNTVMVCISNLRKKVEEDPARPQFIETIRGLGYRFAPRAV